MQIRSRHRASFNTPRDIADRGGILVTYRELAEALRRGDSVATSQRGDSSVSFKEQARHLTLLAFSVAITLVPNLAIAQSNPTPNPVEDCRARVFAKVQGAIGVLKECESCTWLDRQRKLAELNVIKARELQKCRPQVPGRLEKGMPVVQCAAAKDALARLTRRLSDLRTNPAQQMALQRARDLSRAQSAEFLHYDEKMRTELFFYGLNSLSRAADASRRAKQALESVSARSAFGMKVQGVVSDAFERLDKFEKSALGIVGDSSNHHAFVVTPQGNVLQLWREPLGAEKLLELGFSGSEEEVAGSALELAGQRLSGLLAGPIGEASFDAAVFALSYTVLTAERRIPAAVLQQVNDALSGLDAAERDARYRIQSLNAALEDVAHGRATCFDK